MLKGLWLDGLASNSWVKAVQFQTMLMQGWQMASSETWDNSKGKWWLQIQVSGLEMQVPHAWKNPYSLLLKELSLNKFYR